MKVYELHHRPGLEALVLADRPSAPLQPNEVRLRVRAVSLNWRDTYLLKAASAGELKRPVVPVSDGAGEIIEVGAAVSRFKTGSRVIANCCPSWIEGPLTERHMAAGLGIGVDGMLAQEVVLPEEALVALPEHLSFEEGATLPCAGVTAWNALFEIGRVRPGDVVLVLGTGGVSLFALQLARAAGAEVIVTSKSAEKLSRASTLGATHAIDYIATPDWSARVLALTSGRGADIALDVGGPGTFDQSVAALRFEGNLILIGTLTGFGGAIDTLAMIRKATRVSGVYIGPRRMLETLAHATHSSRMHPIIDGVYDFTEASQAYERLGSGEHFGKVVIAIR